MTKMFKILFTAIKTGLKSFPLRQKNFTTDTIASIKFVETIVFT